MSGLKPEHPDRRSHAPSDSGCLITQEVPAICLRLQSHRQRIALPYALLLRAELSEDETTCVITFATHEVSVQGRHLESLYVAVAQGYAAQVGLGRSASLAEGSSFIGPLVTQLRIDPLTESDRGRR